MRSLSEPRLPKTKTQHIPAFCPNKAESKTSELDLGRSMDGDDRSLSTMDTIDDRGDS